MIQHIEIFQKFHGIATILFLYQKSHDFQENITQRNTEAVTDKATKDRSHQVKQARALSLLPNQVLVPPITKAHSMLTPDIDINRDTVFWKICCPNLNDIIIDIFGIWTLINFLFAFIYNHIIISLQIFFLYLKEGPVS